MLAISSTSSQKCIRCKPKIRQSNFVMSLFQNRSMPLTSRNCHVLQIPIHRTVTKTAKSVHVYQESAWATPKFATLANFPNRLERVDRPAEPETRRRGSSDGAGRPDRRGAGRRRGRGRAKRAPRLQQRDASDGIDL